MSYKKDGLLDKLKKNEFLKQFVNENNKFSLNKMLKSDEEYKRYRENKKVQRIEEYINGLLNKPKLDIEKDEQTLNVRLKKGLKKSDYDILFSDIDELEEEVNNDYKKNIHKLKETLIDEEKNKVTVQVAIFGRPTSVELTLADIIKSVD